MLKSDVPERTDQQPPLIVTTQSRSLVGSALQVVFLVLLLSILAGVLLMLFTIASIVHVGSGVGSQLGSAADQARSVVTGAQQAIENATDPNHPPVGLVYDSEFSSLAVWHVGDGLPGGTQYVLTIQSIQRRSGASTPDTAEYAVVHAELRQPKETRILGQLIHSDSDPHDYAVYKGELFRIGQAVYRVNWVSQDQHAVAAGILRNADAATQPLKFEYE